MKSGLKFLPLIGFYLGPLARGGVFVRRSKKSKEFAIQQRLQPLQHVLTPRVKAVHHSIQALHSSLTSLVQMTIAYARTMEVDMHNVKRLPAPSMSDILLGNIP